jgi:hypothetical protein
LIRNTLYSVLQHRACIATNILHYYLLCKMRLQGAKSADLSLSDKGCDKAIISNCKITSGINSRLLARPAGKWHTHAAGRCLSVSAIAECWALYGWSRAEDRSRRLEATRGRQGQMHSPRPGPFLGSSSLYFPAPQPVLTVGRLAFYSFTSSTITAQLHRAFFVAQAVVLLF